MSGVQKDKIKQEDLLETLSPFPSHAPHLDPQQSSSRELAKAYVELDQCNITLLKACFRLESILDQLDDLDLRG